MPKKSQREQLIEAVGVTAELTGTTMSEAAVRVMVNDLECYPLEQVFGALVRCRREARGPLRLADVVSRLDDGRPGPEEAWAIVPKSETDSVVWSEEMRTAFGVAVPLLDSGDEIGARMAFKEAYTAEVTKARAERRPTKWTLSRSTAINGEWSDLGAVNHAVEKGRITEEEAQKILPEYERQGNDTPRLEGEKPGPVMEHLQLMRELVGED